MPLLLLSVGLSIHFSPGMSPIDICGHFAGAGVHDRDISPDPNLPKNHGGFPSAVSGNSANNAENKRGIETLQQMHSINFSHFHLLFRAGF